ncbi:MAG: hypothetical protein AB7D06_14915 [Pedobacter sp.]
MNYPKPREKVRKGNYPYVFVEMQDYKQETGWKLQNPFDSEWLAISTDGVVTVKANQNGYAWDGCTPKFDILNLVVVGVPDGHFDYRTGKPYTYRASMVHDALYQYLDSIPIRKSEVDKLFFKMLGDFKLRYLYYWAMRLFGGWGVDQEGVG